MAYLDDLIRELIELRHQGIDDDTKIKILGMDPDVISFYERYIQQSILNARVEGKGDSYEIARMIWLSPKTTEMFLEEYTGEDYKKADIQPVSEDRKQYSVTQATLDSIRKAISNGIIVGGKIAEQVGCSSKNVHYHLSRENIKLPSRRSITLNSIRTAILAGDHTDDQIAARIECSRWTVRKHRHEEKIKLPHKRTYEMRKNEATIRRLLASGERSIHYLCKITGLSPATLWEYRRLGVNWPTDMVPYPHRPEIDGYILPNLSIKNISETVGIGRESTRAYMHASGMYPTWKREIFLRELKSSQYKEK